MSNIIKCVSKSNDIYYQPDKTYYTVDKYVKAIIYPQLVKNINSNLAINTNKIIINGDQYLLPEGYYLFGDIISLFMEAFLKANTEINFLVNGPNSYSIVNSGSESVTFVVNNNVKILLGINNNTNTLTAGQSIGPFNMNVSLGADVIEIYVSGIDNTYVVPVVGDYLGKVSFYPPSRQLFCLANQPFKEVTMRVDYVAISASEELKTPVNNRIIFSVE
jgi:hypothetical protein